MRTLIVGLMAGLLIGGIAGGVGGARWLANTSNTSRPVAPAASTTSVATVDAPSGSAALYTDDELKTLAQLHSTPSVNVHVTNGTHVAVLDGVDPIHAYTAALVDSPQGLQTVPFTHVRVVDGSARESDGWIASVQIHP